MKLKIKNLKLKIWSGGYTLVEILIVMAIMSIFGVMAIYGIRSTSNSQSVTDAQRNFISDLRATQNKVINGADGVNSKNVVINSPNQYNYVVDGTTIKLPNGVYFLTATTTICFNNPSLTTSSCTNTSFPIIVSFSNGSTTKRVTIEGAGLIVNRIYAN